MHTGRVGMGVVGEKVQKGFMEKVIVHNCPFFIHNIQSVLGIKEKPDKGIIHV